MSTKPRYSPKTFYLHLLNGAPAWYNGEQIVFTSRGPSSRGALLVSTLEQIKKEQRAAERWCYSQGLDVSEYDYVRVRLP